MPVFAPLILYVDDDPLNLEAVGRVLQRHGYNYLRAHNGTEGLQLAEEHRPDVILLDILMPDIDGFEVKARLKKHPLLRNIPVVALTASLVRGDGTAVDAGFDGFLPKPISRMELIQLLEQLTNDHREPSS